MASVANPKFVRTLEQRTERISDFKPHWQAIDPGVVLNLKFLNADAIR
jgi:hypothetical protein